MLQVLLDPFIISFYLSLIAIFSMIGLKAREMRSGNKLWISKVMDKTNDKVASAHINTKTFFSYFNRKSAVAFVQWIAYHVLSWARAVYIWLHGKAHAHPPSKKVLDMVRGRGEIKRNGGASFHLKRISKAGEDQSDGVGVVK